MIKFIIMFNYFLFSFLFFNNLLQFTENKLYNLKHLIWEIWAFVYTPVK